jgi:glutamine amidotransferase
MIAVIDHGMGNSGSILNMLSRIGAEAVLTRNRAEIAKAEKLVLPGIGAFDEGMGARDPRLVGPLSEG